MDIEIVLEGSQLGRGKQSFLFNFVFILVILLDSLIILHSFFLILVITVILVVLTGLHIEVWKMLNLSPHKIGILDSVGDCQPYSAFEKPADQARVVTFSDENAESVFVLQWWLDHHFVGEVDLPQQIAVVVGFEARHEEDGLR